MYYFKSDDIQFAYSCLIEKLLKQEPIGNTKELTNCCIEITKPNIDNYHLPYRDISEKYLLAELKWYLSGSNSCEEIGKSAKMWYKLTDDGITNNSAYGYILFKKYGFNQVEQIIELLKQDKNSRRAILNISDPTLNRITTHDLQCTIAIQFLIRDNELQETVYMRSNDVYFGLPYDYYFFVLLGKYIANELGIKLGLYTHHATSMHMYLKDIDKFKKYDLKYININYKELVDKYYEK